MSLDDSDSPDTSLPLLLWGTARTWTPREPGSLKVEYDAPGVALRKQQIQQQAKSAPRLDLTGQRIGKLTVQGRNPKRGRAYWRCVCDCTRIVNRQQDSLRQSPNCDCGPRCPLRVRT